MLSFLFVCHPVRSPIYCTTFGLGIFGDAFGGSLYVVLFFLANPLYARNETPIIPSNSEEF
jgi:hypothetical protein